MKILSLVSLFLLVSNVYAQIPTSWKQISLGSSIPALSTSDELYCWGNNYAGQLGVGLSDVHRVTRLSWSTIPVYAAWSADATLAPYQLRAILLVGVTICVICLVQALSALAQDHCRANLHRRYLWGAVMHA